MDDLVSCKEQQSTYPSFRLFLWQKCPGRIKAYGDLLFSESSRLPNKKESWQNIDVIAERLSPDQMKIVLLGPKYTLDEMTQQLLWLAAAFRLPSPHRLALSAAQLTQPGLHQWRIDLSPLQPPTRAYCWHHICENISIATGFPVPARGDAVGLELPFQVMFQLAEIEEVILVDKQYHYLRSWSTVLIPTAKLSAHTPSAPHQQSLQWHLLSSPLPGSELRCGEKLSEYRDCRQWVAIPDVQKLGNARTFLGYCAEALVKLGTELAEYENLRLSSLPTYLPRPAIGPKSISLSGTGLGHMGLNVALDIINQAPIRVEVPLERYEAVVLNLSREAVILYDSEARRGWLVKGTHLMLHLVHVWCASQKPTIHLLCSPTLLHSHRDQILLPVSSGTKAYCLENLVMDLYKACRRCTEASKGGAQSPRGFLRLQRPRIFGWEFLAIA